MNRRSLLTVVSPWFGSPGAMTPVSEAPLERLAGRAFAGGTSVAWLTVIVRNPGSPAAAERVRLALLAQAGEVEKGLDIHATHVTGHQLPSHLAQRPASLVTWDTVAGATAVRARWAAGYVRRDGLVWEIIATGADPDAVARLVGGLATQLTVRPVTGPHPNAPRFSGGLWSLLPTESELPASMRLDSVFTDDGVYDAQTAPLAA